MNKPIDLEALLDLVDLPDRLIVWSLELSTGEIHPSPEDGLDLVALPTLTSEQILGWMSSFANQTTQPRLRGLLTKALQYPAPEKAFTEILSFDSQDEDEWKSYFEQRRRTILVDWLHSLGFEPGGEA